MSGAFHTLEITELAALIASRDISPVEVTRAFLDRIEALDGRLHAYVRVTSDAALAAARDAEQQIAAGTYFGPLHGVPLGIKDLFWTKGVPTAAGGVVHEGFVPNEDATVVRRLREAGAVILGKLQMTEGAYSDHHPSVTPPVNPWHPDHWSGISSSGSGVATAGGLCAGSLGSDTGGSIRWPCAAAGLTGLKPTWGRVSRHGVFALAGSFDHVGPIGRSVADVAALLGVIAGHDPADATSRIDPVPDYRADLDRDIRGVRIGVDPRWNREDVDAATRAVVEGALAVFRDLGAQIVEVVFPDVTQAFEDWYPAVAVEASLAHASTYPSRKDAYGPALASALEASTKVSAAELQATASRRLEFRGRAGACLAAVDALLLPVQPFAAPTVAEMEGFVDKPDLLAALARYTCAFNTSGHPTLVLPGGFTEAGLPIGFQLAAEDLGEPMLLRLGAAFQRATGWHRRRPPV